MKNILLSLLLFVFSIAFAGQTFGKGKSEEKLSARLRAQIAAKEDYVAKPSTEKFKALKSFGLQEVGSQIVFLHSKTKLSKKSLRSLKRLGVEVNEASWIPPVGGQTAHTTWFVSAKIPVGGNKIGKVAKKSFIERIETAEQNLMPLNDLAAESISAIPVWDLGHNGLGIKIAVLDSGLDTSHLDIPTPLIAEDYSNYPSLDKVIDNEITGHGTHVTGSALGRGTQSNGKYKGIAPAADLIFLKIGNDYDSSASSSAIVAAIKAAVDEYGADIINISYGGSDSFKDGSDEICQAVDYAKSKGVIVFVAAGNEGARQKHYSGTAGAFSETDYIKMDVAGYVSLDMNWFDGLETNDLHLRLFNADKQEIPVSTFRDSESARGTELEVLSAFVEDGIYYIRVENNSNTDQLFHLYSLNYWVTFTNADPNYTILTPALADGAVAVASYTTRPSWINYLGDFYDFGGTIGDISSFSSRGPRIDGLEKPNLAAPGEWIISARDKILPLGSADYLIMSNDDEVNDGNGPADYLLSTGTSMSCPIVAGGAALLMQANHSLKGNPDALIDLLQETASGGGTRNDTWGYGKINLLAALNAIPTPTPTPTPTPEITPVPSPSPTETSAPTPTPIPTPSPTPDITPLPSPNPTGTSVPSPIPVITPTPLPSPTETSSPEPTPVPSPTPEETPTLEPLPTPTPIVGGGGGGNEPFTEGFEVESTNPQDGATDVIVDGKIEVAIKVAYNQNINGDPLALDRNGSGVEFRAEGTELNLPVTLEPRGKNLIIKPSEPLEKGKAYTLKIFRRAIKAANAGGTQMSSDFKMKFSTKSK